MADPGSDFTEAWGATELPFAEWVIGVSDAFEETDLTLEAASKLAMVNPAELEAVLHLAMMDAEDLELLGEDVPPKSTWFLLAAATPDGVRVALEALKTADGRPAFEVVEEALRSVQGPSEEDRVAALPGEVFKHLASKAKQYDALTPRARKALADFGTRIKGGRPLTPRQLAWAVDLLEQLADARVVVRGSPDGDVPICDQVLDAIGR
jgi:hypothetical protein